MSGINFSALSDSPEEGATPEGEAPVSEVAEIAAEGADVPEAAAPEPAPENADSQAVTPETEASVAEEETEPAPEEAAGEGGASDAAAEEQETVDPEQKTEEQLAAEAAEREQAEHNANAFSSLMNLAAGKVTTESVELPAKALAPSVSTSAFQSLSTERKLDPEAEAALEDLVSSLQEEVPATPLPAAAAVAGRKPGAAALAPGQVPAAAQQPMMMASGPAPGQSVGELAGRAVAGAVAMPFIALSSAARHLASTFKGTGPVPTPPATAAQSVAAGQSMPLNMLNTLEEITDWKCERIERAATEVGRSAAELTETPEFVVWDEAVQKIAKEKGMTTAEVISQMPTNPDLKDIKEGMDKLWTAYPERVAKYRSACDDFERNIRNVVKEFPNSDEAIKGRVTQAMKNAEESSKSLPGFGDNLGEYMKSFAERVRELAKMIAEFVQALVRKVGGKTRASDLTAG